MYAPQTPPFKNVSTHLPLRLLVNLKQTTLPELIYIPMNLADVRNKVFVYGRTRTFSG